MADEETKKPLIIPMEAVIALHGWFKADKKIKVKPKRMEVKRALIKAGGDRNKAREILIEAMKEKAPDPETTPADPNSQSSAGNESDEAESDEEDIQAGNEPEQDPPADPPKPKTSRKGK